MPDVLGSTITQVMLWLLVLAFFVGVGVVVVRSFRGRIDGDKPASSEMLSNFREIHLQGGLSDAEFRTIKTVLGARLHEESKGNSDKG